jgi:hypothetical protein
MIRDGISHSIMLAAQRSPRFLYSHSRMEYSKMVELGLELGVGKALLSEINLDLV